MFACVCVLYVRVCVCLFAFVSMSGKLQLSVYNVHCI